VPPYLRVVEVSAWLKAWKSWPIFSGGMPMFFPSKQMMLRHYGIQSVSAYWGSNLPPELIQFSHKNTWLDLADFYEVFQSPNIYIFESFDHLIQLLVDFVWKDDKVILDNYEKNIRNAWNSLLTPVLRRKELEV
jgi:hypothetical protein